VTDTYSTSQSASRPNGVIIQNTWLVCKMWLCTIYPALDLDMPFSLVAFISSPIIYIKTWLIYFLLDILATGPMPRHISFVMDGNRRYARRLGKAGKDGHPDGFKNLVWVCICCTRMTTHTHAYPCLGPRALPTPTYPMRDRVRVCNRELQPTQRGGGPAHEAC
jgi:hypothetical protein